MSLLLILDWATGRKSQERDEVGSREFKILVTCLRRKNQKWKDMGMKRIEESNLLAQPDQKGKKSHFTRQNGCNTSNLQVYLCILFQSFLERKREEGTAIFFLGGKGKR